MPSSATVRRQRAMGGVMGVALLVFALVYHFFPNLLHVTPQARHAVPVGTGNASPMGFERRPQARSPELDAGPPLALAPTAVIDARSKPAASASAAGKELPESPQMTALLARADKALQDNRLTGAADSAAALYAQALQAKPDSRRAAAGLDEVHARLVAAIEDDLASGDAEAAAPALAALQRLPGTAADVARLQQSLQSLQQVRPLLAQAATLLQQGKTLQPSGANALAVYRRVMTIDPGNTVAQQGIEHIQREVLDRALGAVAQDDFAGADAALAQAAEIAPGTQALQDTRGRVEGIRRQRAVSVLAQARSALDAGNLKLAQQLKQQALAISPDVPGLDAFDQHMSNARLYASYKPGQVFSDRYLDMAGRGPALVVIPTGNFLMGSSDAERGHEASESPQHEVHIATGFALGRSEVSVAQFREFVRASGYEPDSQRLGGASVYDARSGAMRDDSNATWQDDYAGRPAGDTDPVVNVSWNDAAAYAQWLSRRTGKRYRLPSEAEFEYAERAGTTTRYWWGDGTPATKVENLTGSGDRSHNGRRWTNNFAGYRDGYWGPAPIQSFSPNPFGLYDIGGNLTEWVADCWHVNYTRASGDGSAWVNPGCGQRVLRGGSWGSAPEQVRSAYRLGADASTRSGRVGFRVAREL
ncbi:MAG TPA: formylglycine-generating enzyme family protein [Rhodanobacteraceae bacterium]|nr:formylglycine-generating enzyme family protein [Rhodanobacteraceae bacterium]